MVARDVEELNDSNNACKEIITNGEALNAQIFNNAEVDIPECRKQLLDAKDNMFQSADMFQQDYLDQVERRSDLTNEAKDKAVLCLLDVSEKIYKLAGCFQKLITDQASKLEEIEKLTLTASTSLEVASCQRFRHELINRLPTANVPVRQPRIGRPEAMQTEFFVENVIWEKLNFNKLDSIGCGGVGTFDSDSDHYATVLSQSTSQVSLTSTGSSKSHVTHASSTLAPIVQDNRLTASSIDVSREPSSPSLNRCNSSSSLTSTKSLRLLPTRAAPAPPPVKTKQHRSRVYSVKNETGEGLEKPAIPAPMPPPVMEEHYAVPPSQHRPLNTVSEDTKDTEVIYDHARQRAPATIHIPEVSQYQQIVVQPPSIPSSDVDDEDIYQDLDEIYDTPPPGHRPKLPSPDTPSPQNFERPYSGIFGPPKSGITLSYNRFKKQNSVPILTVIPPPTVEEDSDNSEFEDPDHLEDMYVDASGFRTPVPEEKEADCFQDDDIYDDINTIYDAPSLKTPTDRASLVDPLPPAPQDGAEDNIYTDNDMLPPPPPDILPPPPNDPLDTDDIYVDADIGTAIVSDSKDSGFYAEDVDEDDVVIDTVHVIFPYTACANDELDLVVGDVVLVHVKNPDGWFEGTLKGVRGLFPGNYVVTVD